MDGSLIRSSPRSATRDQVKISRALFEATCEATELACRLDQAADAALAEFFRDHRQLGSHDRPFVADTVFTILRHKRLLETIVPKPAPHRLVLASLLKFQGFPLENLLPLSADSDRTWLTHVEQTDSEALPPAIRLSLPDWLWQSLRTQYGEDRAISLAKALLEPAPLDLRVNTLITTREKVLASFAADGMGAQLTPYSPIGIRLKGKPSLHRNPLMLNGAIEVQDEGSQLLGLIVEPARRQMVVDFCAGAGGKTLLLGAMMRNQGRLYAFDISATRLEILKQRAKRAHLSIVQPQMIGSERDPRIARLAGKVDRVLVDAPCSGLGTLRRSPELKWRQSPHSVKELANKQRSILDASSQLLKPGGRLIYATCSLLADESQNIVEDFLTAQNGRFRLLDCQPVLESQHIDLPVDTWLQVLPDVHHCDGFFAAVMERAPEA